MTMISFKTMVVWLEFFSQLSCRFFRLLSCTFSMLILNDWGFSRSCSFLSIPKNKARLCCTLYQRFLCVEAMSGLCLPTIMSVAKVENCWLQDSYPKVPPTMITHPTCVQISTLCLSLYYFVDFD